MTELSELRDKARRRLAVFAVSLVVLLTIHVPLASVSVWVLWQDVRALLAMSWVIISSSVIHTLFVGFKLNKLLHFVVMLRRYRELQARMLQVISEQHARASGALGSVSSSSTTASRSPQQQHINSLAIQSGFQSMVRGHMHLIDDFY